MMFLVVYLFNDTYRQETRFVPCYSSSSSDSDSSCFISYHEASEKQMGFFFAIGVMTSDFGSSCSSVEKYT